MAICIRLELLPRPIAHFLLVTPTYRQMGDPVTWDTRYLFSNGVLPRDQ